MLRVNPEPENSSDLDWMLQSGQAGRADMAGALSEAFCPDLYRLALILLGEPAAARAAADRGLAAALMNLHHYRPRVSARGWFFRAALPTLDGLAWNGTARLDPQLGASSGLSAAAEVYNRLPRRTRIGLALQDGLGFSLEEAAWTLRQPVAVLKAGLEIARRQAAWALQETGGAQAAANLPPEEIFSRLLAIYLPIIDPNPIEQERAAGEAVRLAGRSRIKLRRMAPLHETGLTLLGGVAVVLTIWFFSQIGSEPPAASLTGGAPVGPSAVVASPSAGVGVRQIGGPNAAAASQSIRRATYLVRPGDTVEDIATGLGVEVGAIQDLDGSLPGGKLNPGGRLLVDLPQLATTVHPIPPGSRAAEPPALTDRSTPAEIVRRVRESAGLWDSLWLEAGIATFGPADYSGPAQTYRVQASARRTGEYHELSGPDGGKPVSAYIVRNGISYYRDSAWTTPLIQPDWQSAATGLPGPGWQPPLMIVSQRQEDLSLILPTRASARDLVFPALNGWLNDPARLRVSSGGERTAGRATVMVDIFNPYGDRLQRIWLDALTGLALRVQEFGRGQDQPSSEMLVTRIDYNSDLPGARFDPWQTFDAHYLNGPGGGQDDDDNRRVAPQRQSSGSAPEPVARPPGFDPSAARLAFQALEAASGKDAPPDPAFIPANLYADGVLLGETRIGRPGAVMCRRSPDGSRLAYLAWPERLPKNGSGAGLWWFDLNAPNQVYRAAIEEPGGLAFAPDGRQMAVFGRGPQGFGVYLMEIATGEMRLIYRLTSVRDMALRPDGEQIAVIGAPPGAAETLIVIRTASGTPVYQDPAWDGQPKSDWPTSKWGVDFPAIDPSGLDDCVAPPS
jgi:DNA-directed RNA polymerase specialized sigma24 family protein